MQYSRLYTASTPDEQPHLGTGNCSGRSPALPYPLDGWIKYILHIYTCQIHKMLWGLM